MPKAGRKKPPTDPLLDIQDAINRKMHRQHTPHTFICKHDLIQVWADHPLREIFPKFDSKDLESIRDSYLCILSILILIDWTELRSRFRPVFLREPGRDDEHLPFTDLAFLGTSRQIFSDYQFAFTPVIIEEHTERFVQEIPTEYRLPFTNEPKDVRLGGYGSVTKRIIAPRCLKNKEDNRDNPEPNHVACKIYRNENPLHDFKHEVRNLDYIKEGLTDSKRVMKHIAAIVHGNEFMIVLPHADLYDLEIFLRGGYDPDPNTDDQRKIYDFDDMFPRLKTSVILQRALIEEAHQLASALKWLHEDLKIFGSSGRYLAHMDLKPANVLLVSDPRSPAGKWMLSDFGVSSFDKETNARAADTPSIRDVGHKLTSRGFQDRIVRGHGPYQPPEVDLENVDSRKCDVWSFSCVLCDILAFAIGRTDAVYRLRNSRYNGGDDYFYRAKTPVRTEISDLNTELKPQIVHWWENLARERSSPGWATKYVKILSKALQPKPSDRPDIAAIVSGLDELAPSMTPQESPVIGPESESLLSNPRMNGLASQENFIAHQRPPSIMFSDEPSTPQHREMHLQDTATIGGDYGQSSSNILSPRSALLRQRDLSTQQVDCASQSSSSNESQSEGGVHAPNAQEPCTLRPSQESVQERRNSSVSMLRFKERPTFSVSLPKKDKTKAVAINPSPLQVAILCKRSVHLYLNIDGEEISRCIDLAPKVDWKKIRLSSQLIAVYGVGLSSKKHIEIFDSETTLLEATDAANGELAQDILLSDRKIVAYVYDRGVKLYHVRSKREWIAPILGDDALIIEAKFSASGKILCVWACGTRADHAYFFHVDEELASATLSPCGKGSYRRQTTNLGTCEIWPSPDSPICIVHEAHGGTFIARPLNQPQAQLQSRDSIGILDALSGCVVREDLLVCLTSRRFHSAKELFGYALSPGPQGQCRIASQRQSLGAASKDIEKSTTIAVHLVNGKIELVLGTTSGKVLRYVES